MDNIPQMNNWDKLYSKLNGYTSLDSNDPISHLYMDVDS